MNAPVQPDRPLVSSRWIVELEKQIARGKHVLLYGGVYDQHLWQGVYYTSQEFLIRYFTELKYELIVTYDPVDYFDFVIYSAEEDTYVSSSEMQHRFGEIVNEVTLRRNPGLIGSDTPLPEAAADGRIPSAPGPDSRQRRRGTLAARRPGQRIELAQALSEIRYVLSQGQTSVAVLINLGDMLASDAMRFNEDERRALITLKKGLLEASILNEGPRKGYRNTVVISAGDLSRVPVWLHRENPLVSIVQAAHPDKDERYEFLWEFAEFFHDNGNTPDRGSDGFHELCEEFANLTDGFQAWDLDGLRRTSIIEEKDVNELSKLIDFYKFGIREDPWERLDRNRVAQAKEILGRRVIGQDHAIVSVSQMLTTARIGLSMSAASSHSSKPKGIFFFVGPTGVGKTELAKAITELVFDDEKAFARFDMSEYKEQQSAEKLTGASPGFVGYEEGGQLTNRVLERPHSILLFDEMEKADASVFDKFLQILEDGRLTDGQGRTAYFNQTAIIFTSNIGASELYERARREGIDNLPREEIIRYFTEAVRFFFTNKIRRAEILNRLGDNIVVFDLLRLQYVKPIARKFLNSLDRLCLDKYELDLEYDDSLFDIITREMDGPALLMGGRQIRTLLESLVEHPLNEWVFENFERTQELAGVRLKLSLTDDSRLVVERLPDSAAKAAAE